MLVMQERAIARPKPTETDNALAHTVRMRRETGDVPR